VNTTRLIAAGLSVMATAAVLTPSAASARPTDDFQAARAATARFHSITQATAAGYGELPPDVNGLTCISDPAGSGGMGIHYVNGGLVGDAVATPDAPDVLVYEPQPNGQLKLVALEYVIFESAWRAAGHTDPNDVPMLYGQKFERLPGPEESEPQNRYGLPAFYELHVWLWEPNPAGMFDDWNPNVSCP
jgi:hypothetical protein